MSKTFSVNAFNGNGLFLHPFVFSGGIKKTSVMKCIKKHFFRVRQSIFKRFPQSIFKRVPQSRFKRVPQSRFKRVPN